RRPGVTAPTGVVSRTPPRGRRPGRPATAASSCRCRHRSRRTAPRRCPRRTPRTWRSEEHTSELQSRENLVCRLLLEKKNIRHLRYIETVACDGCGHHPDRHDGDLVLIAAGAAGHGIGVELLRKEGGDRDGDESRQLG